MNTFQLTIILATLANAGLGILVLVSGWKRAANRGFAILSLILGGWLFCLWQGAGATNTTHLEFWIRAASICGILIPIAFDILRHAIVSRDYVFKGNLARVTIWLICATPVILLCTSRLFITSARVPTPPETVAVPQYGPAVYLYFVYFISSVLAFAVIFKRNLKASRGVRRLELQYVALASAAALIFGFFIFSVPIIIGNIEIERFLPTAVILLDVIIAYGIATRKITGISHFLRTVAAYSLLALLLIAIYLVSWLIANYAAKILGLHNPATKAHLAATVIVAISVIPARGWAHKAAYGLFIGPRQIGIQQAIEKANTIFAFVTSTDELLASFGSLLENHFDTDRDTVMLLDKKSRAFIRKYPPDGQTLPDRLAQDSPIGNYFSHYRRPVSVALIERQPPDTIAEKCVNQLSELGFSAALGIYTREGLAGITLLGHKNNAAIYDSIQLRALQIIVNHLGVAVENAQLYTALQDSKAYNDLVVRSLINGLIVVDNDLTITVMNQMAEEITGLQSSETVGQPAHILPQELVSILKNTLLENSEIQDVDTCIRHGRHLEVPIRVSAAKFYSSTGEPRGALLMLHDVTELKKLEDQLRRTDRLSSLGTLSAGMAHEIKNPLVSIKTFTQLLPERYQDAEFRKTFFELIGQEIERIDSIVERLLSFARPAKPTMAPTGLHDIINETLKLLAEQAKSSNIKVVSRLNASNDTIIGDRALLKQALLNFLLNSIQAMPDGGILTIRTGLCGKNTHGQFNPFNQKQFVLLSIMDSGCGIDPDNIAHVFDPFFSKRRGGTGLGLSVAHSILQEHNVFIDIESKVGHGTAFHLSFLTVENNQES